MRIRKFAEESPLPPPEIAEQGVYCDGCHTIEAEWRRPKKEVMPPASSEQAIWKVADFGAFKSGTAPKLAPAHVPRAAASSAPAAAPPEIAEAAPETDLAKQAPLRVPFGRGPKHRSVELEQREKAAERPPQPQNRPHKFKPHKRRRR